MRTIDADALMADLEKWLKHIDSTHPQEDNAIPPMEDIIVSTLMTIEEQPTIEPQRMRGRWIGCGNSDHWKCSVCGTRAAFWFSEESSSEMDLDMSEWLSDFCPNCGSYNGGEQDVNC